MTSPPRRRERGRPPSGSRALLSCALFLAAGAQGCGYMGIDFGSSASGVATGGTLNSIEAPSASTGGRLVVGSPPPSDGGSLGMGGDPDLEGDRGEPEGDTGESDALATGGDAGFSPIEARPEPACFASCEDFESDFVIAHTIGVNNPGAMHTSGSGSFEFAADFGQREGDGSLMLTTAHAGDEAEVGTAVPFTSEGAFFFRSWLYAPTRPQSEWIKVLGVNGYDTNGVQIRVDNEGRMLVHSPETGESWQSEAGILPIESWFCLQVVVQLGDEDGRVDVRVNNTAVVTAELVDARPDEGIVEVVYGMADVGPGEGNNTLYFDRVRGTFEPPICDE